MHRPLRLALISVLTVACQADYSGVTVEPAAPVTTDALRLELGDAGSVSVSWLVDGVEVEALRDALEVSSDRTVRGQSWTAQVWGGNNADRTQTPDAVVEVVIGNTAPVITGGAITPEAPRTTDTLWSSFTGEDLDGDRLYWRVEWLRDGEVVAGLGSDRVLSELTTRGETWTVRAWLSDGDIEVGPEEVSVMIDNVAPVAHQVVIDPAVAFETTELVATPTGDDADGDAVTWIYSWYVDGAEVGGKVTDRLDGSVFDRGQEVVVHATPSDGFTTGEPVVSKAVVIQNSAPTATGATIQPSLPTETDTVSCIGSGFADVDGDPEGWQVVWTVDGAPAGSAPTLDGSAFSREQSLGCTLVPFDGDLAGEPVVAAAVTVQNTAPVLASAAIDPASPVTTDTLSATLGAVADVDDDTVGYTYAWTVDGAAAGTDATLPGSAFARDQVVGLTVTPTDGTDAGVPVVAATVTVQNSAPTVASVVLSPSAPATDDAITASVTATDADGDELTYSYTWSIDGAVVAGETSATLPSSAFVKGESVSVSVVADDGTAVSTAVTSAAVVVVNTAPTLDSASIDPGTLVEGDTATCVPSGFADVDGDSASYTYAWTVDGVDAGVSSATLDSDAFDRGQAVVCIVTPGDGTDDGTPVSSGAVIIGNTAPVAGAVSLSTTTPQTGDDLVGTVASVTDVDGDEVELTWVWTVDGGTVRSVTTSALTDTLPAALTAKGNAIQVAVTPADDADAGATVVGGTAVVQNTAPVITTVSLSPSSIDIYTAVTASVTASDVDGDSLTTTYAWFLQDEGTGGFVALHPTTATLPASEYDKGDVLYVEATVDDGAATHTLASATITVGNAAPVAPTVVALSPADPAPTDTLTCTASGGTDPDGDSVSYRFNWYRDDTLVRTDSDASSATFTLSASDTGTGQTWTCAVESFDGTDASASTTDDASTVILASDCDELYAWGYRASEDYDLDTPDGSGVTLYCEMRSDGGWTQVVAHDYTVAACPSGWPSASFYGGSCHIDGPAVRRATLETFGISYADVRVNVGLSQYASMDGFAGTRTASYDAAYGDGFALLYNDGGLDDVHTWVMATDTPVCSTPSPIALSGGSSCASMFGAGPWSTIWDSGYTFDGWRQFSLGTPTDVDLIGQIMADQDPLDENMAVRHLYIMVK